LPLGPRIKKLKPVPLASGPAIGIEEVSARGRKGWITFVQSWSTTNWNSSNMGYRISVSMVHSVGSAVSWVMSWSCQRLQVDTTEITSAYVDAPLPPDVGGDPPGAGDVADEAVDVLGAALVDADALVGASAVMSWPSCEEDSAVVDVADVEEAGAAVVVVADVFVGVVAVVLDDDVVVVNIIFAVVMDVVGLVVEAKGIADVDVALELAGTRVGNWMSLNA